MNDETTEEVPPCVDIAKAVESLRKRARDTENEEDDPKLIVTDFVRLFTNGYLDEAEGVSPWDAWALDQWAFSSADDEDIACARFILSIWGPARGSRWKIGRFDVLDMTHLSGLSTEIIAEWFKDPFWFNEP